MKKGTYVFRININVSDDGEVTTFLETMEQYLCLTNLLPESPLGFCLGVVEYEIEGNLVRLLIFMINDSIQRPWVRQSGPEIRFSELNFEKNLKWHAEKLYYASS